MDKNPYPDDDTHVLHHRWAENKIEREKGIRELRYDLFKAILKWTVLGILGGIFLIIWWGIEAWRKGGSL